jgi:ABC-type transporter Mla subunit MlaD
MKVTAPAKVGLTAIALVLVFVAIYHGMGWPLPWEPKQALGTYTLTVGFASVKGLDRGADVQLNGNAVGEVAGIDNDNFGGVQVSLSIKDRYKIHKNAAFTILRDSIFGGYLVSIDEARSGYMENPPSEGVATVYVRPDSVEVGGSVFKAGVDDQGNKIAEEIGWIISVTPAKDKPDEVIVTLDDITQVNTDMAFLPWRPSLGELTGFIVYDVYIPGDTIAEGEREAGPEDLIATASKSLEDITSRANLIIEQVSILLNDLNEFIDPEQISTVLDTLSAEATTIARNIDQLTTQLNSLLSESQPHILGTLENVEGLTGDTRQLVADLGEYNTPELRENIDTIVTNLAEATGKLNDILLDLEKYTSDEELRLTVKDTISQAHATLIQAQDSLDSVNQIMSEMSGTVGTVGNVEAGGGFTLRYNNEAERWAEDFDFWVGAGETDAFLTVGVSDIGETDRGSAQAGFNLNDSFAARAGVHRGKMGLGIDWRSNAVRFASDLYDPNNLTWDVYGGYAVMPDLDIIIGVEDLLEEDEVNFGLTYRF